MIAVSPQTLIGILVALLFAIIAGFSWLRLIPLLSPSGARLALGMLALQVVVIALGHLHHPPLHFDRWLWDLHEEWNVAAALASLQLGIVGGIALTTAWLARARRPAFRLYCFAIAIVFFFLGLDEYLALHEFIIDWELRYIALGMVVVAATLLLARHAPKSARLWHACFLFGLALSVAGALALNALPVACDGWLVFQFDKCIEFYVLEEALEFGGIWLTLVAMLGHFSAAIPSPSRKLKRLVYALPAVWILLLTLNALLPRVELRFVQTPASAHFASGISLLGYAVDSGDSHVSARLYATATQADYMGLGLSLHLIDQASGESMTSEDEWADRQHGIWLLGPEFAPIYRQSLGLRIPPGTAPNRALSIVLSLWRRGGAGFERLPAIDSDLPLLSDAQVILGEMTLKHESAASSLEPLGAFANGFALQSADLPDSAFAGETLPIQFTWRSDTDSAEEYGQFLHLGHEASGAWFVYDQRPLGDRLPTRLWYTGMQESETWSVPLPEDLAPGQYSVFTGLYRATDKERLPVTDATGAPWLDMRIALGSLVVEA